MYNCPDGAVSKVPSLRWNPDRIKIDIFTLNGCIQYSNLPISVSISSDVQVSQNSMRQRFVESTNNVFFISGINLATPSMCRKVNSSNRDGFSRIVYNCHLNNITIRSHNLSIDVISKRISEQHAISVSKIRHCWTVKICWHGCGFISWTINFWSNKTHVRSRNTVGNYYKGF